MVIETHHEGIARLSNTAGSANTVADVHARQAAMALWAKEARTRHEVILRRSGYVSFDWDPLAGDASWSGRAMKADRIAHFAVYPDHFADRVDTLRRVVAKGIRRDA